MTIFHSSASELFRNPFVCARCLSLQITLHLSPHCEPLYVRQKAGKEKQKFKCGQEEMTIPHSDQRDEKATHFLLPSLPNPISWSRTNMATSGCHYTTAPTIPESCPLWLGLMGAEVQEHLEDATMASHVRDPQLRKTLSLPEHWQPCLQRYRTWSKSETILFFKWGSLP